MTEATPQPLSRATAAWLVAAIALVSLALSLWELRVGLPGVLHSDYVQVGQALDLVRTGEVADRAVYPLPLVYAYAAADVTAYAVGHALGWQGYADWPTFLTHLAQPQVHHAIARALGALCSGLLAIAAYRLARVRFDRGVAVLAAALAGFSPLVHIYAHQVRPHIPVITLVVLAGPAVLRAASAPALRTGFLSGLATGLVSGVFQIGLPYYLSAGALVVLLVRPFGLLLRVLLAQLGGFLLGWLGVYLLCTRTGLLADAGNAAGPLMRGSEGHLGYGMADIFDNLGRFPKIAPYWLMAESFCALATVGFLVLCLRRKRSWRDVILHSLPAMAMLLGMCSLHVARPRYSMYATPFLAPLAASACLAIPGTWLRRATVALLVAVPLASSIRHDWLLSQPDTRIVLTESLSALSAAELTVSVEANILPTYARRPQRVSLFPPGSNYRAWLRKEETPRQTLARVNPDVFIRGRDARGPMTVEPAELGQLRYVLAVRLGADRSFVPDDPEWVLPELWQATRPGPPVDYWSRAELVERVRAALPPAVLGDDG